MKSVEPAEKFIIDDLDSLKAIVDPLRAQILETLVIEPLTVKQIAERLGVTPSKLYYHVNTMETHGFIQVVETRMVANMVEKYYRATAMSYEVDPELLAFQTESGKENIHSVLLSILDATKEDLSRTLEARAVALEQGAAPEPRSIIVHRYVNRIPEDRVEEFHERLTVLLDDFSGVDVEAADKASGTYALAVAFYPTYYFSEPESE